ncbi:MAG: sodium:calcium antiporter [Peptococcaceae bacterium]|nr:sodium:calcium antiporter [Peptococcaceae bacterium]
MIYVLKLLLSLVVILLGAKYFTNGMEWVGKKYNLTHGAVGSLFAAVGTALPETLIPILAIVFGTGELGHAIGIGAILGAPFMLSTIAFVVLGTAALIIKDRASRHLVPAPTISFDFFFFLSVFPFVIGAAFLPSWGRQLVAIGLILGYGYFVYYTWVHGERFEEDDTIEPLAFGRAFSNPPAWLIVTQVLLALGAIIGGARLFVDGVTFLSVHLGVPAFVFALLIAPIATEMPEKFNSVIWIGENKDSLALGNITGAMAFQGSLIPALGMVLTPWKLTPGAFWSAAMAWVSVLIAYLFFRQKRYLSSKLLIISGGTFYVIFIILVVFFGVR